MRPAISFHPHTAPAIKRALLFVVIALASLAAFSPSALAQGFGLRKMEGQLRRTHPPGIYLPAATVVAQVDSLRPEARQFEQRLRYDIERAFNTPGRPAISAATTVRTLLITCTITDLYATSRTDSRNRSEYKKTGEHTETDTTTNMSRTVDDYGWVTEWYTVAINEGRIRAAIEVKDADTGLTLDAGEVPAGYYYESEWASPLSDETIYTYVVDALVSNIAGRYRAGADSIAVPLPKGKLKDASEQLARGRWNMALELLRAVPEFQNPHDDAYRLYSFGLAYEGLAYEPQDAGAALALLRRAAGAYAEAAQRQADEGVFIQARLRVVASTAEFTAFLDRAAAFEAARGRLLAALGKSLPQAGAAAAPPVAAPGPPRVGVYKGVGKLKNDVVVRWLKAGLSEDEIVANITQSRANEFDLSPRGLVKLKQAGASDQVLLAMQSYQTPRRPGRKSAWLFGSAILIWQYLPLLLIL